MGLINAVNCNKENMGLGIADCAQYFGEPSMPILVRKGWSMLREDFEALDAEGFLALVQSGDWIPIPGAREFTMDIPEPTTQEFSGGVTSVIRNGKPVLNFNFDKGVYFHKALYSKNSFGQYNTNVVDDAGNIMFALSPDGTRVTAITTGMVNTGTYNFKNGDTSASTPFQLQFTNEEQFNRRMAVYSTDQSGIDFNEILRPITSTVITGTAEAGEPILVSIKFASNAATGVEALAATNFRIVNTATNAVVTINTVTTGVNPGDYVITPTTPTVAGQTLRVELYDATATPPVAVAIIEPNQLYSGMSAIITVAA